MYQANIISVVERHEKYYNEKLSDFVREDERLWRDDTEHILIQIQYGTLLLHGNLWIPWGKLIVSHSSKNAKVDLKEACKKVLAKLQLKRFFDEDAKGGGLHLTEDRWGNKRAICFINPDYPEGYWENHTLDGKLEDW